MNKFDQAVSEVLSRFGGSDKIQELVIRAKVISLAGFLQLNPDQYLDEKGNYRKHHDRGDDRIIAQIEPAGLRFLLLHHKTSDKKKISDNTIAQIVGAAYKLTYGASRTQYNGHGFYCGGDENEAAVIVPVLQLLLKEYGRQLQAK